MGAHVVDILNALHESADRGARIELTTSCPRPEPLPPGRPDWLVD
jgi:hypothetical protein